jgi:hypothetical protein
MSTLHDTTNLRPYSPHSYPTLGDDKRYLLQELKAISDTMTALVVAVKALEARLVAGGL